MLKRSFDFILSFMGLIALSPLFLVIALSIKISSRGPVFFKQFRVGKGGSMFMLFKFRSMYFLQDATEARFDPGDRSRVTKIGFILRKYKLDELPQLINVIKGDMSLVGPRPEIERWTRIYPEKWEIVLRVRPGITDNSSILYRNEEVRLADSDDPITMYREEILPHKLDIYISYVYNHSFLGDLRIIFKTLISVPKNGQKH
jgi:lipopolysaccharide/colanic/teichoic acid biosynthesis glycosyltransferase